MSRYKDVDELKKRLLSVFEDDGIGVVLNGYWGSKLVREIIDEQPTADVVEVVRCKDCKWYDGNECFEQLGLVCARDDDFCSWGERREDGDNC